MGIPRLSQDVAPYAERAIIGKSPLDTSAINIIKLVIDGPSLVYHIYNILMQKISHPTYVYINSCLEALLEDLVNNGVEITRIIFDGALPVAKRPVRHDRLEKTRQNLDNYRRLQSQDGFQYLISDTYDFETIDITSERQRRNILWDRSGSNTAARQQLLPPPPFMVASAIEFLHQTRWSRITHTVPNEADPYCAREAFVTGSAMLSNDSDLLLYDSGLTGTLVLLRTLESTLATIGINVGSIQGQCIRPAEVAKKMNVPSLRLFGFHRSLNTSLSTTSIIQRAREPIHIHDETGWVKFEAEYSTQNLQSLQRTSKQHCSHYSISGLDPRTAELVCSISNSETLHIYLPIVLEDPTRGAAWSYGIEIRQIAYSVLLLPQHWEESKQKYSHVTEYTRKGPRISDQQVQCLPTPMLLEKMRDLTYELKQIVGVVETNIYKPVKMEELPHPGNIDTKPKDMPIFSHYLFAGTLAMQHRAANLETRRILLSQFTPYGCNTTRQRHSFDWESVHVHAILQSILYSLRMLRQAVSYVREQGFTRLPQHLRHEVDDVYLRLEGMPSISELFLDPAAFRHLSLNLPLEFTTAEVHKIFRHEESTSRNVIGESGKTAATSPASKNPTTDAEKVVEEWCKPKSRHKKRVRDESRQVLGDRHSRNKNGKIDMPTQAEGNNPFALLQGTAAITASDSD